MKLMFVETRLAKRVTLPKKIIDLLPRRIGLFMTLQLIDSLDNIKKSIESTGRKAKIFKTKHTKYPGQIYGCNLEKLTGVDAFVYIGDGLFHPKALALGNTVPVFVYDPFSKKHLVLTKEDMEEELRRQKAAYAAFLSRKNIGVLMTTKHGQSYPSLALSIRKKYPDKEFYFVAFDTIDLNALADFNFVDVWVNTACPRLGWDDTKRIGKPMVDLMTVL
jgi:2-(3-amino-3-carboxypropyl)histidine synthase